MNKFVALLRGVNVGGSNIIPMAKLGASFEEQGFSNVQTYIQSGNVVFDSKETDSAKLASAIEIFLSRAFNYKSVVMVRSREELKRIVDGAPKGFGAKPAEYRSYVLFLKEPLTAAEALPKIPLKVGIDEAWAGPVNVIFHRRLEAKASQSYLNRLVGMPIYQNITIRNWNTTTKLLGLMDQ